MYFEAAGSVNTEKTLMCACQRAIELGIDEVVISSTRGGSARKALDIFKDVRIVAVTYHCGVIKPFESVMPAEVREDLTRKGVTVVSATHALSGIERSVAKKYSGAYPALLIADTLRLFGQGTKVAVEVAIMAADAGALSGKNIIAIGGTSGGVDTALVLTPAHQSNFFDMKIHEIICKPRHF